ncbi:MAG: hypothetical protein GY835_22195 [bacterium]|nr:hypothetical protein [bacterium]
MSLLREIQESAISSKSDLGEVLRRCKLLASRLDNRPIEDWLIWESNGYPPEAEVPEYRQWACRLKGNFSGPFGSGMRNAPIPSSTLPETVRDSLLTVKCRQSISSIEKLLEAPESTVITSDLSDIAPYLGTSIYDGQNCLQVWGEFSIGQFAEVLSSVRNRLLDFVLALEKEAPNAGEERSQEQVVSSDRIAHIFNTTIYGGSANLVGSAANSKISFDISTGGVAELRRTLSSEGVESADLDALETAIQQDGEIAQGYQQSFGPAVSEWIGIMVKKAAVGAWDLGVSAAGSILGQALNQYYGWMK